MTINDAAEQSWLLSNFGPTELLWIDSPMLQWKARLSDECQ